MLIKVCETRGPVPSMVVEEGSGVDSIVKARVCSILKGMGRQPFLSCTSGAVLNG